MNRREFIGAAAAVPAAAALLPTKATGNPYWTTSKAIIHNTGTTLKAEPVRESSEDPELYFQFGDGEKFSIGNVRERVTFMLQAGGEFEFNDGKGNVFRLALK